MSNEEIVRIDLTEEPQRIQDAGIIKDYEVIPLESNGEVFVGEIDKIILHEGLIYIANYRESANVLIFDSQGKFIREIKRQGRGPLEYLQFGNVFIDRTDNTLNLVDRYPAKILKFRLDGSGNPDVIHLSDVAVEDALPYRDGYICYTTFSSQNDNNTLLFVDRQGNKIGGEIPMRDGWESNGFLDARVFSASQDKIYFKPIYESPIYRYNDGTGTFEPAVMLDFGPHNWPDDIKTANDYFNDFEGRIFDYIGYINHYQEKETYWLFEYIHQGQTRFTLYDKATGQSTQYRPDVNTDNYFIGFGLVVAMTENHIVTSLGAISIADMLENKEIGEQYPESLERLRQKVGDIDSEDNPVIIVYNLE
ncbi:MAG: 6-bladed beta-propeller [Rikenellaceae bacterium]|nr:6-bladed beta-propeller [Rikenellaceae bacterium]